MKRTLFILILAIASHFLATAQDHYQGNISIGAKGGVTMSRIQFNPVVPQSFVPGIMLGVTARYIEEKHFGLIAEVNLEQRGWKEKFEGYDYNYQRQLTYIQIPILTHIYFGSNKFHGFVNAGPEAGFLIGESIKSNFDYKNIESIPDFPKNNRYTDQFTLDTKYKFDYGISLGGGIEMIARNKSSFNLEARFYYGLHDVFGNHKKDVFSGSSSLSVMMTLGYSYRVK